MRKGIIWYVWKEHLFTAAGVPDCEWKILGGTAAEHTARKFGGVIVDKFPSYIEGETVVILRSSHTCLPRTAVESIVRRAEEEGRNIFFGAGWALVNGEEISKAKYLPLKAGMALLSEADYPFVAEGLRLEILKRLLRRGVIIENTSGVYVDLTAFAESGAILSHDVTLSGKTTVGCGARIEPYTIIENSQVGAFATVGPFAHICGGCEVGEYARVGSFTAMDKKIKQK